VPQITFENRRYELREQESILEGLLRHGVAVRSSCHNGICQSCMMHAVDRTPPAAAQKGLRESLKVRNYFLACQCRPAADMEVALPGGEDLPRVRTVVVAKNRLGVRVMQLMLQYPKGFAFQAGQFINLIRGDQVRSYSVANSPNPARTLELHVYEIDNGRMSGWIHHELAIGDTLNIEGPFGECVYQTGYPQQPLLLIGTGCGLAPLHGVINAALQQGHRAPIHLFHGSRSRDGLYLENEMRTLAERHPHFSYTACLSGGTAPSGYTPGRAADIALTRHPLLKTWRVYLCGNADMVKATRKKAYLAGAALSDIHADPFEFAHSTTPTVGAV
jgi:ferredoxin-NADP reductase/ferredoxin